MFHLDRYLALLLGSPLGINEDYCDAQPPQNIDNDLAAKSNNVLTPSSFVVVRDQLAKIMGQITIRCFPLLGEPEYTVVQQLERRLKDWANDIPLALSPHRYGETPTNKSDHETTTHRYLISTEFNFTRMALHRPYLTRPDPTGIYRLSRDMCLQAAQDDLWARTIFCMPGVSNLSSGSYRVSQSLTILGYALVRWWARGR